MPYQTNGGWKNNNNNNNSNGNSSNINKNFHQSQSYHSIIHHQQQQQQQQLQSNSDNIQQNIVGFSNSKSINNLSDDGFMENAELIEKLFPKCRPKTKITTSNNNNNNNKDKRTPMEYHHDVKDCCDDNDNNDGNIKNDQHDCSLATVRPSIDLNKKQIPTTNPRLKNSNNRINDHGKRIWNFMGISPSPSPPTLSPIEDNMHIPQPMITTHNQQQKSQPDDRESKSKIRSIKNERMSNDSTCSRDRSSSNETSIRKSIPYGGNETNNTVTTTSNSIHRPRRLKNQEPTIAAKLRLDSLLLSPEDDKIQNVDICGRQDKLDYDLNDEDDILFSRINMDAMMVNKMNRDKNTTLIKSIGTTTNVNNIKHNNCDDDDYCDGDVDDVDVNDDDHHHISRQQNDLRSRDHHLAMAGGNELFSSSRSTRSKKRYQNNSHQIMSKSAVVKNKFKSNIGSMVIRPSFNFMDLAPSPDLMETTVSIATDYNVGTDKKILPSSTMPSSVAQFRSNKQSTNNTNQNNELLTNIENSSKFTDNIDEFSNDSNENLSAINHGDTMGKNSKYSNEKFSSQQQQHHQPSEMESTSTSNVISYKEDCQMPSSSDINIDSVNDLDDDCSRTSNTNNCATIELVTTNHRSPSSSSLMNNNKNRNFKFIEHQHQSFLENNQNNNQECERFSTTATTTTTLLPKQTELGTTDKTMIDDIVDDNDNVDENIRNEMNLVCEKFATDLKNKLSIVSKNNGTDNVIVDDIDDDCNDNIQTQDYNNFIVDHKEEIDLGSESDQSSISIEKKSEFDLNEPIARIIGSVPIAQYEGSPKRYGPKPGYPQRIISSNNNVTNNDYDNSMTSIQQQQPIVQKESIIGSLKSTTLSSANGSPHSSSTSATYSSTDVHSSSSFSCPSNRPTKKSSSEWRSTNKSKMMMTMMSNDSNSNQPSYEESSQNSLPIQPYPTQQTQITCDEVVKSILNISNTETAIDSETDNTSTNAKPSPMKTFNEIIKSESIQRTDLEQQQEFNDNYMISSNANKITKSSNAESSSSSSLTKMATLRKFSSITNASATAASGRLSDYLKMNHSGSLESSDSNKSGDKYNYHDHDDYGSSSSSHHLNQEFRKNYTKSHYTKTHNDENELQVADSGISNNDLQLDQTSATSSTVDNNNNNNNDIGRNRKSKLNSFICLSPELANGKDFLENHQYSTHLNVSDLCLSGNGDCNRRDYYNKEKISSSSSSSMIPENDTRLINIMPVLEDGLSSGMPSSDDGDDGEMMEYDYDDDDGGDDQDHITGINNEQQPPPFDDYNHEYQTSNGRTVIGCETTTTTNVASQSSSFNNNYHQQQSNTMNVDGESVNQNSYDFCYHNNNSKQNQDQFVAKAKITNGQPQPSYFTGFNVGGKNNGPYTGRDESTTTSNSNNRIHDTDDKDSNIMYDNSNSYEYHPSSMPTNFQMITADETNTVRTVTDSTTNSLSQTQHHPKRMDMTDLRCQTGQQTGIAHDNKYCLSSSSSNRPMTNSHSSMRATMPNKSIHSSSLSANQNINNNNNTTLSPGSTVDAASDSPQSPPHSYGHNSYHHYFHHHPSPQPSSVQQHQQNYPNLSSSPTMLQSPNSPGDGSLHHHHHHHHHNASSSSASSAASSASSVSAHHGQPPPPSSSSSSINHHQYHHYHKSTQLNQSPTQDLQSQATQPQATLNSTNATIVPGTINISGVAPIGTSSSSSIPAPNLRHPDDDCDTDQETDRLLGSQRVSQNDDKGFYDEKTQTKRSNTSREARHLSSKVLIEGVLFRARYLGSTQLVCDGQPTKATRMMQAEEAVSRIKAPEGESQPSTEVDLFISTEKIMVLNTDLKEIMMDHALRTISYIADIGDLLVLMARRRSQIDDQNDSGIKRSPKMICHVFESEEAQYIAQSIGQAFQVAYMEFLKANGIKDSSFLKEMDYQEVLNSQEIFGDELEMFSKREKQKEVIVPKQKGEILGIVIVESGWGSMLPTVVIANLAQNSPSARCGQLNIGDQIIAINGISLVGLPLSTCQNYVKNTKNQTVVKFTIVPCPPVVEVKIKRPDTKYQLGFSVQNGVICSLLRGGIAERGGVRVGHRIIEINGQSVVAVPHDRIVNLLATSVGEIHMKTMPTSMFRLLTGQEAPSYM
ncbi:uncharacterized protein LOC124500357 isoform X1 [Dermatophagoides farinae]|uniref:uncharacterized protein LOC124500357 isoform X1 n=1 Tax=Dermatophagoides farinae TaxID=6954 RepID=UPI001F0D0EBB|nr:probable serine/threonine-protein kinase DDB_G0282963 isoform X3 [Dermatophagoides farinae]